MADENASANNTATPPETGASANPTPRTFSQDDVNRLIDERLKREREKYADYTDLKAKAAKWQEHEDAQKSELEKLQAQIADWQNRATQAEQRRQSAILRSSVMAEAAKQGVPADRIEAAYKLLDATQLSVGESDTIPGLEEAIKAMLEVNPFLLATGTPKPPLPRTSPTNPAANPPTGNPVMAEVQARLQGQGQTFGRGGVIWNKETDR